MNFSEKYGIPIGGYVMYRGEIHEIVGGIEDPAVILRGSDGEEHCLVIGSPLYRETVKPVPTIKEEE